LSCPLTQITQIRSSHSLDFTSIVALTIQPPASEFQFENEAPLEPQILELGPIESIAVWDRLCNIISDAKQRAARTPSNSPAPVIVDFGPYNFFENEPVPSFKSSSELNIGEENSIRCALGFSLDSKLWSK
jgi:sterol 3beta-glucosyltransferase